MYQYFIRTWILALFISSLFSLDILYGQQEDNVQTKALSLPNFSPDAILAYKSGLRPCREGGIRLEAEYWQDKLIIHDYGHGGAGISLSWGSAQISVKILKQELRNGFQSKGRRIAILGSGIIGLTTAHLLADNGWQVYVYAAQFPPHTTSNIAPGLWGQNVLGGVLTEQQVTLLNKIAKLSKKKLEELSQKSDPEFKGVSPLDVYIFKPAWYTVTIPIMAIFEGGKIKQGWHYRSLIADTSIYIPDLFEKAKAKGVKFNQMMFQNKEDLSRITENIIFNCTGLGSRKLFNDHSLYPVRGHLIELKPQEEFNYVLVGPMEGNLTKYIIPIQDKIIVGSSYESDVYEDIVNEETCQEILENTRQFFSQ